MYLCFLVNILEARLRFKSVPKLTVCPDGMCTVLGPGFPTRRFRSLMLAKVPRVITASFPLRAPYELNSRGVRLGDTNQMWSTVEIN